MQLCTQLKKRQSKFSFQTWINTLNCQITEVWTNILLRQYFRSFGVNHYLFLSQKYVSIKIKNKQINFLKTYRISTFKNQRGSNKVVFRFFRSCRFNHKRSLVQNDVAICTNLKNENELLKI